MKSLDKKGSILIGVLWSLFFLSALAISINSLITPQLNLAAKLRDRVMLRNFAEAGMKRAIIEIRADKTQDYDGLNDLWSQNEEAFKEINLTDEGNFSLEYSLSEEEDEESEKRYGLIDEERKININTATAEVLNQFFKIVGEISSQEAEDITDAIIDWRDEDDEPLDNGAESSYYESLDPGYTAKNTDFEILEEILLIREMSQTIYDKVKGYMTVYGEGKVNINTADTLVLQSLGMSSSLAEKIISYREGDDGQEATEDDNNFENAQNVTSVLSANQNLSIGEVNALNAIINEDLIDVRSDHFRGHSFGSLMDRAIRSEIVFVINRDEQVRYWREF